MTPPRSAFGVLAGRVGPEAQPFGRHKRHAACVRPQPPQGGAAGGPAKPDLRRPLAWRVSVLLAAVLVLPASLVAQSPAPAASLATLNYGLKARALADGVYVVEGAVDDFSPTNGCNIINTGFISTGAGVLVINTGPSKRYGEQLRALIARTTAEPVVQVIHLNLHPTTSWATRPLPMCRSVPPPPPGPACCARPVPMRTTCTACAATG